MKKGNTFWQLRDRELTPQLRPELLIPHRHPWNPLEEEAAAAQGRLPWFLKLDTIGYEERQLNKKAALSTIHGKGDGGATRNRPNSADDAD